VEHIPPTDEKLIDEFNATGDPALLDELTKRHIGRTRAFIYQMVLNHADADDLAQETFIRAFRGLPHFRGHSTFTTWLFRIATNTTRTFLARRTRDRVTTAEHLPDCPAPRRDAPDSALTTAEVDAAIRSALDTLTPPLRAAIVLRTIHRMDVAEIARIESCTIATVYWRIHQARRQLKHHLSDVDIDVG